jgi:hypothetical protein
MFMMLFCSLEIEKYEKIKLKEPKIKSKLQIKYCVFVVQLWDMVGIVSWIHAGDQRTGFSSQHGQEILTFSGSMELAIQWGLRLFEWGQVTIV